MKLKLRTLIATFVPFFCFLGACVDFANKYVYWADDYLDYVEKVDYYGNNRKSVARGVHVSHMFGITAFENRYNSPVKGNAGFFRTIVVYSVFVASWHENEILELSKMDMKASPRVIVKEDTAPYKVHVFHRQKQPDGKSTVIRIVWERFWFSCY